MDIHIANMDIHMDMDIHEGRMGIFFSELSYSIKY